MKITKLGHCCLLIEENGVCILTDPGVFLTTQNELENIGAVLITHEHQDHFHVESLKIVLKNNPNAIVFTNHAVGKLLDNEKIAYRLLMDGQKTMLKKTEIKAIGSEHAVMHSSIPNVENTGFLVSNWFFYPGDAFTIPNQKIEILALPVTGPWMKFSEAVDYALKIKPVYAFAVHDSLLIPVMRERFNGLLGKILSEKGIRWTDLNNVQSFLFD